MYRIFQCVVQLCLSPMIAMAQSTTTTVEEFGLVGTWANDCDHQASASNEYAIFSVTSGGQVRLRNDFGPGYGNMIYNVTAAKRISFYRLSVRQLFVTDACIVLEVVMLKSADRIRVWSSHRSDGYVYVEDGLMPSADGQESGWMLRCQGQWVNSDAFRPISLAR